MTVVPRTARRATAILSGLLLLAGLAWAAPAPLPPAAAAKRRVTSLQGEPGYRPLVDPESSSVALGRRTGAPLVSARFAGGAPGLDALGRAVCRALHATSPDSMKALCITDTEFRDVLWPEFPQSRPATGILADDAWKILFARLRSGCSDALRDHGGHWYEFQRLEADSVVPYRNFRLFSGLTLVVKDDEGVVRRWRWLRAVVERRGSFKIYSTDD